ncbi:unnamed protein product [Brachionus calyciflorus]|uniref:Reverse transcriptase domain-containing protein n=1 Tax=Brachionus calyciflorus TaxID=104777 RepID=A0A814CZZ9_9BILA|nr:unnamed protein product [Brachionus calyciflorus]
MTKKCLFDIDKIVTLKIILEYLNNVNTNKAMGVDGFSPYFLKQTSKSVSYPLFLIIKKSFGSGEIPIFWRLENVSPVHKQGNRSDPKNYRPISLTSLPCRIAEKIIRDLIINFLTENELINPKQHGFIPQKSYFLTYHLSLGKQIDIIFTDFSKAFDRVNHKKLLRKLKKIGIDKLLLKWIESFLKSRKQRVVLGDVESDWLDIFSGVPQSSVLGPLLFFDLH